MTAKQTPNRAKLIQLIHIGRAKVGMSAGDYRILLADVSGKESCANMTMRELERVLKALRALGFTAAGNRVPDKASEYQLRYINLLWRACARVKTDAALGSFVERITGTAGALLLSKQNARKVILALRDMCVKTGVNPDAVKEDE
jgi:hypothetical protein